MLKLWEEIVASIAEDGDDDYLVEYDNDLWIRKDIETLLEEVSLEKYKEFDEFKERISAADKKLKACFLPNVERGYGITWWEKGVLKNGSGNYLDDINEGH